MKKFLVVLRIWKTFVTALWIKHQAHNQVLVSLVYLIPTRLHSTEFDSSILKLPVMCANSLWPQCGIIVVGYQGGWPVPQLETSSIQSFHMLIALKQSNVTKLTNGRCPPSSPNIHIRSIAFACWPFFKECVEFFWKVRSSKKAVLKKNFWQFNWNLS